jgi:hypothetical protein
MTHIADLELSLHRQEQDAYAVDFRFSDGDTASQTEVRLGAREAALAAFDFHQLRDFLDAGDLKAYGQALTAAFFGAESLRTAFAQARAASQQAGAALRIRLAIAANALELHPLRWELLNDPQTGSPLATDQTIHFSRYLSSQDWRPVRLRSRGELSALAVIAAPEGLAAYKLASVDRAAETAAMAAGLGNIRLKTLEQGTLNGLVAALSAEEFDLLYLVAHGTFASGEAYLWLEDEAGQVARVAGAELVNRLRELEHRPRLVVLAACQSAGQGSGEVLSALGPRLAEIGIPAVLAMQANLRMDTAAKFIPLFFSELQKDGQIDRALAVARDLVREQPDWWVPALFMRLKSGRLWYTPGFADAKKGFEKFPAQIQNLKSKHLTPILGAGLLEGLLDAPQQIARSWAETFRYPMAPHERESLPQVAQFLTINQQKSFPYEDLMDYLRQRLQTRFAAQLSEELRASDAPLTGVLEAVGKLLREGNPDEPHRALAELPVEIYLTTNADTLLEGALKAAGKKPQTRLCPWNAATAELESEREDDNYTVEHPLVYHFFGQWKERASLVLTEDNYFDFLLGMARNKALIPLQVKKAMTDSGLLFLGFQTHEWQFRVLFRAMLSLPGQRYDEYANIAAQVEPEDGRILDPQRAREYLEQYFFKGCKLDLSVYWGTPDDFIKELMHYWRRQA